MATYWVSQRLHLDLPILSYINTQMDFLANTIFYRWEKWAPLKKISDLLKVTQLTATEQWHLSYFKTCCPFQKQTCSGNLAGNEKEQTTISGRVVGRAVVLGSRHTCPARAPEPAVDQAPGLSTETRNPSEWPQDPVGFSSHPREILFSSLHFTCWSVHKKF